MAYAVEPGKYNPDEILEKISTRNRPYKTNCILFSYNENYKTIDEIDRSFNDIKYKYRSIKWTRIIFMYVVRACINNAFVLFKKTTKQNIGIKKFTILLRNYCYFKALKNATSEIQ